ncbi:MAG: hypothetical protein GEV08_06150 [Acidimicrobiia bacterium]|nr:hypothetical protein [Acidimicrobiia bacterium]
MAGQPASRRPARRARQLNPRSPGFVDLVLRPVAARAADGAPTAALAEELYEGWVHHWALGEARRQADRLPSHADRDEVTSQVLRLAWEACLRIDWSRLESWPAFLERKVGSARAEAARVDDWLSRRERTYRRRYQRAVADLEQSRGRATTPAERFALAGASAPASSRVDWARELVTARHPAVVAEVPDVADADDVADHVEEELMRLERAACLEEWLTALGGEDSRLAADLRRWCEADDERARAFPSRLARRVAPFAPLLAGLLVDA